MSKDVEFQEHEDSGAVDFGGGDTERVAYDDNAMDRTLAVGSAASGWRKFKNFFKKIFKGVAKSKMAKDALNSYSPGAGDAMEKGIQLIDSASSGNKDALKQIAAIAKVAKENPGAEPAHELLTTLNEAKKEVKAETVTAMVGAAMQDIESLRGRHFRLTEKKDGKEMTAVMKIINVHPEAYIEFEVVGMPGSREWIPLSKLYNGMLEKEVVWSDEKGVPLATGQPVTITIVPVAAAPTPKVGAEAWHEYYTDRSNPDYAIIWYVDEKMGHGWRVSGVTGEQFFDIADVNKWLKSGKWKYSGAGTTMPTMAGAEPVSMKGMHDVYVEKITPNYGIVWVVVNKLDDGWQVYGRTGVMAFDLADIKKWIANGKWKLTGSQSYVQEGVPYDVGGGGGGFHHGGHVPGFMRMDPRDLYWGPRVDFDDDGQPVFVGHHHGGHGGGRGWGVPYAPWGGMWGMPMWEEVEYVEDVEEPVADEAAKAKRAKKAKETLRAMAGLANQDWTAPDWSASDAGEEVKKLLEAAGIKKFIPAGNVIVEGDSLRVDLSQLSPKQQRKANNLMAMTALLCKRGKKIVVNVPAVAVGGGGGGGFHHHGSFPGGVMMGPGWGDYSPYPYPGADPWMFEEMAYESEG